jgi:hypothetical protein
VGSAGYGDKPGYDVPYSRSAAGAGTSRRSAISIQRVPAMLFNRAMGELMRPGEYT